MSLGAMNRRANGPLAGFAPIVRVMLMKVVAAVADLGSTPSSSTKDHEKQTPGTAEVSPSQSPADWLVVPGGAVMVSTGLDAVTGGIRKATPVIAQNIIAKPMTMAAAA